MGGLIQQKEPQKCHSVVQLWIYGTHPMLFLLSCISGEKSQEASPIPLQTRSYYQLHSHGPLAASSCDSKDRGTTHGWLDSIERTIEMQFSDPVMDTWHPFCCGSFIPASQGRSRGKHLPFHCRYLQIIDYLQIFHNFQCFFFSHGTLTSEVFAMIFASCDTSSFQEPLSGFCTLLAIMNKNCQISMTFGGKIAQISQLSLQARKALKPFQDLPGRGLPNFQKQFFCQREGKVPLWCG